jgi:polyribonucleotide nucleotidyltransferase
LRREAENPGKIQGNLLEREGNPKEREILDEKS